MQASGWALSDEVRCVDTIRRALAVGLNFLVTAVAHGDGYSEEWISKAITGRHHQVIIATKFDLLQSDPKGVRHSLKQLLRH